MVSTRSGESALFTYFNSPFIECGIYLNANTTTDWYLLCKSSPGMYYLACGWLWTHFFLVTECMVFRDCWKYYDEEGWSFRWLDQSNTRHYRSRRSYKFFFFGLWRNSNITGFGYNFNALNSEGKTSELYEVFAVLFQPNAAPNPWEILQAIIPAFRVFVSSVQLNCLECNSRSRLTIVARFWRQGLL